MMSSVALRARSSPNFSIFREFAVSRPASPRHFLRLSDLDRDELQHILKRATELRIAREQGISHRTLPDKVLAMIFEKSSTRTRVSFEAGMAQLGGSAMFLSPNDTQLGRGEPVEDTARVISSMVDVVMIRTFAHDTIERFARNSSVPVINGLTDDYHPCQLLADLQTFNEHCGSITGRTVAWVGDGNNVCNTFIEAAQMLDFELRVACPRGHEPLESLMRRYGNRVHVTASPVEAVANADLVVTDVWASMGQESQSALRLERLAPYQVDDSLMSHAASKAMFMHCLPAHRGEEVTADVIDGERSLVWHEAENRLHAQKALLEFLLGA